MYLLFFCVLIFFVSLWLTGLLQVVVKFVAPIVAGVVKGLLGLLGTPPGLQVGELL